MLILSRKRNEKILIGEETLTVLDFDNNRVIISLCGQIITLKKDKPYLFRDTAISFVKKRSNKASIGFSTGKTKVIRKELANPSLEGPL